VTAGDKSVAVVLVDSLPVDRRALTRSLILADSDAHPADWKLTISSLAGDR